MDAELQKAILALRDEAWDARDYGMVEVCNIALGTDEDGPRSLRTAFAQELTRRWNAAPEMLEVLRQIREAILRAREEE